jgi:hypothetical protein
LPVRSERRRPLATHRCQILLSVLVVRHREHAPVCRQPFYLAGAVDAIALCGPARRIGAAKPMQGVLHHVERHVGAGHFDSKNDKVDIIEEVKIDMPDVETTGAFRPGKRICAVATSVRR